MSEIDSAVTSGFYDSLNHDRLYNTRQLSSMFDGIILDGIFSTIGDSMIVTANDTMELVVGTGRAWFNNSWTVIDPKVPITVPEATQILPRIDAIVIDVDQDQARKNTLKYITGEASATPKKPVMIKDTTHSHYQYPLAYISVKAGVKSISQSDVTNTIGTKECPFVTGALQQIDVEKLLLQWQHEYDVLYANLEKAIETAGQKKVRKGDVSTWFTVKIPVSEWKDQGEDGWICLINSSVDTGVIGLLEEDEPIVSPVLTGDLRPEAVDAVLSAWGEIYSIRASKDSLLCTAYNKPDMDITIHMQCVRK